uniref:Phycobiliprotein ApcE n=1 Tax=Taenioma perpusillum TaxID=210852 RepID=A0A1Z1MRQ8_9FLOR|nr:phycobilisome linker polypeptide [Taenioma perpusillum]ARW68512.1 phycobilisome linker polypeptide [Taenioma perpusillum]
MVIKASSGSPLVKTKLFSTLSITSIIQAEQQDRFLELGELNQLAIFLNSGNKRLEIAKTLAQNANFLVSKAADKIFVGGSAISYLERPQASYLDLSQNQNMVSDQNNLGNISNSIFDNFSNNNNENDVLPPGFKPINIARYGSVRMKKSLRDLDWFLRYLTYSIIAGDTNILCVNIRGLRELIDNACSSAAAIVALREMRQLSLTIFRNDKESSELVEQYFNIVISEFEAPGLSDKIRKRSFNDLQGLRLPQIYANAGSGVPRFVMKSSLSDNEKNLVIQACYRQIFERDISKAYSLKFTDLESQVKTGQLSIKEFIRFLLKSSIYRKQFYEPFVNSRVIELAFKHILGRGISSLEEFQRYFSYISNKGLEGIIDSLLNSIEYADYFGEETVPYIRSLGQEAQESKNWGAQIRLFNYSAFCRKIPDFITLLKDYQTNLPDQHPYGLGNDPLAIQFGAIFPNNVVNLKTKSAFFDKDSRRILLRNGPGIYNQISNPNARSLNLGYLGPKIFSSKEGYSLDTLIRVAYIKIFGRSLYQDELVRLAKFEAQLKSRKISIREFISLIVKSVVFRNLYWNSLYICKSIEYIHMKLIGRPTYGRQEINQYFDIVYKKSYYSMIDTMLSSAEYLESFGEDIIPYERYITPFTLSSRNSLTSLYSSKTNYQSKKYLNKFTKIFQEAKIEKVTNMNILAQRINQGVTTARDQIKVFKLEEDSRNRLQVLKAIYRQIFERDLNSFIIGDEFYNLEKAFLSGDLNVKQIVEKIGSSSLYMKEFYNPYPNTKVIELGTKHFLGRAPNNQSEIRYYNQILASQGMTYFISSLVNSIEYNTIFSTNIVPYRRFPTLPAANFPNTEKLYRTLTKQNEKIIITNII